MSAATEPSIRLSELDDNAWLMELDMAGKSANVFTAEFLAELEFAIDKLERRPAFAGLIVMSAKPDIFIAGADLVAIQQTQHWNRSQVEQFCRRGQELFGRLSQLPGPVVAAIHGVCVGGGLEFALACHYRLGSAERKTLLGLPEVKLGLIPGWGGTARLPRLAGLETAATWTCSGELQSAETALQTGVLDGLVPRATLRSAAESWVRDRQGDFRARRERLAGWVTNLPADLTEFSLKLNADIAKSRLDPTAPRVVLEQLLDSHADDLATALRKEASAMARVYGSPTNAALLNVFFLSEHAKKLTRSAAATDASDVRSVGIVGVGLMGAEIAALVDETNELWLFDTQVARAEKLAKQLNQRPRSSPVRLAASLGDLGGCDLIFEAIPENLATKRALLAELERHASSRAIVATNTSVISVAELAAGLAHPERFCGLHFCYPVATRPLVEVIAGPATEPEAMRQAARWLAARRRVPLRVADHPGFIVNRVLCPMFNEANHLVTQGNSPEAIDLAMRDAGFEFGPLEFIDLIGIDVSYAAALWLFPRLPTPLEPCLLMHAIHRAGFRGKKSASGYYAYDAAGHRTDQPSPIQALIEQYARATLRLSSAEIVHRLLLVMANQAADAWWAKTGETERDIDLAMLQGGGVPERLGGVLHWAQRQGPAELLRELEVLEADPAHRGRFRPTAGFQAWARAEA